MSSNDYLRLKGKHAVFSPSQPSFFNLTEEEFRDRLISKARIGLGTELHNWAFLKIKRRHTVTSIRDTVKSIDEFIFDKYYIPEYDTVTKEGVRLLRALSYLPQETFENLKTYVNDAVHFNMEPEKVLYYSDRFFGTTDAVVLSGGTLRIHDLKTGTAAAKVEQLIGYDALYCLQFNVDPFSIAHELRLYQNNDILVAEPKGEDIQPYIDKIILFDLIQKEFEEY